MIWGSTRTCSVSRRALAYDNAGAFSTESFCCSPDSDASILRVRWTAGLSFGVPLLETKGLCMFHWSAAVAADPLPQMRLVFHQVPK